MAIVAALTTYAQTDAHESAHAEICKNFNGTVIEKVIFANPPHILCNISDSPEYELADSNVESFGYQIQAEEVTIWSIALMMGILLILLNERKQSEKQKNDDDITKT